MNRKYDEHVVITPDDPRFYLIQLWLHTHNVEDYIDLLSYDSVSNGKQEHGDEVLAAIKDIFPDEDIWFSGEELIQVACYDCDNPELHEKCAEYVRKQGIKKLHGVIDEGMVGAMFDAFTETVEELDGCTAVPVNDPDRVGIVIKTALGETIVYYPE